MESFFDYVPAFLLPTMATVGIVWLYMTQFTKAIREKAEDQAKEIQTLKHEIAGLKCEVQTKNTETSLMRDLLTDRDATSTKYRERVIRTLDDVDDILPKINQIHLILNQK